MGNIYKQKNGTRKSEVFTEQKNAERELRERERAIEEIAVGARLPIDVDKTFDDVISHWETYWMPKKRSSGQRAPRRRSQAQSIMLTMRDVHLAPTFFTGEHGLLWAVANPPITCVEPRAGLS